MIETLTLEGLAALVKPFLLQDKWNKFEAAVEAGALLIVGPDAEPFARQRFPNAEIRVSNWVEAQTMYALDGSQFDWCAAASPETE